MFEITAKRQEIKFITKKSSLQKLLVWINNSTAFFRKAYDDRRIYNIYFDDFDFSSLDDNFIGVSNRHKIRLRWYNSLKIAEESVLEEKIKTNILGYKKRHKIIFEEEIKTNDALVSFLRKSLKKDIMYNKRAVCFNYYNRRYFECYGGKIRLTIDDDLYFQQIQNNDLFSCINIEKNDVIVVEIKFANDMHENVLQILENFPLRQERFSKYVNAFERYYL